MFIKSYLLNQLNLKCSPIFLLPFKAQNEPPLLAATCKIDKKNTVKKNKTFTISDLLHTAFILLLTSVFKCLITLLEVVFIFRARP